MIELKGITWDHPRGYAPLQASTERYLEKSGIRVNWQRRTLKDFGDISIDVLADKYDLLVIDHPHMGTVNASGCLIDLNKHLTRSDLKTYQKESVGPSFLSYNYNNHQYAIPVDAACQVAAYRADLFESKNIPNSWDEVQKLADNLNKTNQFLGMALCATDCNCTFLTLSAQLGYPAKENSSELIPLCIGVRVLQLMKILKESSHPESLNMNPIQLYTYMTSQDDVVYSPLAFAYINYTQSFSGSILSFCKIPGKNNAVLGGAGMAVSAKSNHIKEAVEYLNYICSPSYQQSYYVQEGGQPGQLSAWKEKTFNPSYDDFFSSLLNTIEQAYVRPRSKGWPEYQEWLGDVVHEYLVKNKNPENTIKTLNEEYKESFR